MSALEREHEGEKILKNRFHGPFILTAEEHGFQNPVHYLTPGGDRVDEAVYFTIVDDLIAAARAGEGAEGGGAAPSDVQG